MKLIKPFYGVPDGALYPKHYAAGDDCPTELISAAQAAGCLVSEPDPFSQPEKTSGKKDKHKTPNLDLAEASEQAHEQLD